MDTMEKMNEFEYDRFGVVSDDDADYKPILQGVINTRCNYDGGKIEGNLEE